MLCNIEIQADHTHVYMYRWSLFRGNRSCFANTIMNSVVRACTGNWKWQHSLQEPVAARPQIFKAQNN